MKRYLSHFGDASDYLTAELYQNKRLLSELSSLRMGTFAVITEKFFDMPAMFLKQIHGINGYCVNSRFLKQRESFSCKGDFLITQESVALGVLTADCLPVVVYDTEQHAVGIAHAGWRGAVAGVVPTMIKSMKNSFGTNPCNLIVQFGPCAQVCCYEVSDNFEKNVDSSVVAHVIQQRKKTLFFDLSGLVRLQLCDLGVQQRNIKNEKSLCTMCNRNFWSYRRQGRYAGRQISIVSLVN